MKHIFFLILSAFAFYRCQTPETPKKWSLECYVRYLAPERQIRAEATLQTGDSLLQPVAAPGAMSYQRRDMKLRSVQTPAYYLDNTGGFEPAHTFEWKDEKGQSRQFSMQMSPITKFSFGSKTLSRQQPTTCRWEGAALGKGEAIVFLWENAVLGKTVPMEVYNTGGIPAIEFPAVKIGELDPGTWTLYLVRKKLTKADVNGVAASGIIEYYTTSDTIQVK